MNEPDHANPFAGTILVVDDERNIRRTLRMVLEGEVACAGGRFGPGQFFLMPASLADRELRPGPGGASVLRTTIPASFPASTPR